MTGKKYSVSKRAVICWFITTVLLFIVAMIFVFGYFARGNIITATATKLKACEEAVKKPQPVAKKPQVTKRKIVKKQAAPPIMVKAQQVAAVPNYAAPKLILRINVVEWSQIFEGKSLMSRDIGPVIRQGLANGTVVRTKEPLGFLVNGASVSVQDGQAIVDPGAINAETVLIVQPSDGAKFASPPNGLPLTTDPGELDAVVKRGVSEIWLNFILAPKSAQTGAPKGAPAPIFVSNNLLEAKIERRKRKNYEKFQIRKY